MTLIPRGFDISSIQNLHQKVAILGILLGLLVLYGEIQRMKGITDPHLLLQLLLPHFEFLCAIIDHLDPEGQGVLDLDVARHEVLQVDVAILILRHLDELVEEGLIVVASTLFAKMVNALNYLLLHHLPEFVLGDCLLVETLLYFLVECFELLCLGVHTRIEFKFKNNNNSQWFFFLFNP